MDWVDTLGSGVKWLLALLLGGGGIGAVWAVVNGYRKDERVAPQDTAATLKSLLSEAANAHVVAAKALKEAQESKVEASQANRRALQAEETVYVFRHVVIKHVVSVVDWIDEGAHPPPPEIPEVLRKAIKELQEMEQADKLH